MLVVDTSAVLAALAQRPPGRALVARLVDDGDLHAPHLIDIEILNALRDLVRGGKLSADRAEDVRSDVADLAITRYGHERLGDRIWALRDHLTAYDAVFVALAEALEVPLDHVRRAAGERSGHRRRAVSGPVALPAARGVIRAKSWPAKAVSRPSSSSTLPLLRSSGRPRGTPIR